MSIVTNIARIDADYKFIKIVLREKRIPLNISGTSETSRNISLHNEAIRE